MATKISNLKKGTDNVFPITKINCVYNDNNENVGDLLARKPSYRLESSTSQPISLLLNTIYPVGSIRLSINAGETNFMGGTWVQVSQGRALFGAGTLGNNQYVANTNVAAGLPNIAGSFPWQAQQGGDKGAMVGSGGGGAGPDGSGWRDYGDTVFNAARGECGTSNPTTTTEVNNTPFVNNVYGKSDTVQPPAYVIYVYRRTA